jgi:two-component system sensor histidine kinase BarA
VTVDTNETENPNTLKSVIISVTDNGIGIPLEKQNMLFTKFGGQLNTSSSKETQAASSGLGLYITKGIIEAHGGKIEIHSMVGKGTTTTFSLPISNQ